MKTATLDAPSTSQLEDLWHAFAKPLRGYLRRRCRTEQDASDLLQEVFLRIHQKLPTLRDPSKLQGWIYRIAHNTVIDHYRGARGRESLPFDLSSEDPVGRDAVDLTPALRQFIAVLPDRYREPLLLHEFQGQPLRDVARSLGLTLTAAKTRVRRARLLLREMLDRCCRLEFDRRGRVIKATPRHPCGCED